MAEQLFTCPDCSHRKLYFNTDKQVGWCHVCAKTWTKEEMDSHGLLRKAGSRPSRGVLGMPALFDAWDYPAARRYLEGRGVTREQARSIHFEPKAQRLYFRIWSPSRDIPLSFHTRGITKEDGWRVFPGTPKQHYFFGEPVSRSYVVIVEGIFDALRIGPGALAILGTQVYPLQEVYLRRFEHVLVWLDPDEPGRKATDKVVQQLSNARSFLAMDEPGDLDPNHPSILYARSFIRGDL